jgi:hypothetical protein
MRSPKMLGISKGGPTGPSGPTLFLTLSYTPTRHCTHRNVVKNMSSPTEWIRNQWDHWDRWDHLSKINRLGDAADDAILGPYWGHPGPSGTAACSREVRPRDARLPRAERCSACLWGKS